MAPFNAEEVCQLVGRPLSDPLLTEFLARFGFPTDFRVAFDDARHFFLPHAGVELVFRNEQWLEKRLHDYEKEEPVLRCIRFHLQGSDDVHVQQPYSGMLPGCIAPDMSETEITSLLGPPDFSNACLGTLRWDSSTLSIAVRIHTGSGMLRTVSILVWD